MEHIEISTFGRFSLTAGEKTITDTSSRTRKVWLLLAILVCNEGRAMSSQKLMELLWSEEPDIANPENALRINLHRLRALLDNLWPGAGRELIQRREGGYCWNAQADAGMDFLRFESLCQSRCADEDALLAALLEAIGLYQGEFLPRQSSESWIVPLGAHFHSLYLTATEQAAGLLSARDRHQEAAAICRKAVSMEPYHEPLHQILMRELAHLGDPKGAAAVYEALSKRLFDDFGIRPNEETRAVYRAAAHTPEDRTIPMDEVLEHLQEPEGKSGAMQCDYDYFKVLCYAESRAMERSGNATHIALLSLAGTNGTPLSRRSLNRIMEQLGDSLRHNLRRGDTISQCSVSQYIIMLPKANYEDSCMVCRRCIAAFHRAHPHVAAKINYMVQPLTPSICVP